MVFGFCLGEFGCLRQSMMGISVFVIYIYIYIDCIVGILLHSYSTLEETDMSILPLQIKLETNILLMEKILHHLGCMKPCKSWDKLPTSTGAGFLPSTV